MPFSTGPLTSRRRLPKENGLALLAPAARSAASACRHRCGDVRPAARLLPAVRRWLDFLEAESDGLIRPADGYGDWLSLDAETPKDLIGTAYFAHSCRLATELATAAGDTGLAEHARALGHRVRDA